MARNILILIFFLSVTTALFAGIKVGKKIGPTQIAQVNTTLHAPAQKPSHTPTPIPTTIQDNQNSSDTQIRNVNGISSFSDRSCGYYFTIPGSYIRQETVNQESKIFVDQDNPDAAIAVACADSIPRPPVSPQNQEIINLDGQKAILYHDKAVSGRDRDEVIVEHPETGKEIIVAGFGQSFQSAISSFKFIR